MNDSDKGDLVDFVKKLGNVSKICLSEEVK